MTDDQMHDGASFVWRERDCTTLGALSDTLLSLRSGEDAAEFWNAYVAFLGRPTAQLCGKTAEEVASSNIGYLTGYWGEEDRRRVLELFPRASHPVFGRFESEPTPREALEAGMRAAGGA
jgi:hypothetical protein